MTGELLAGAAKLAPQAAARQPFEQYIRRFDRGYRHRLRKLKDGSRRLGELLYTFPGAAVAIAAGSRSAAERREAKRLVMEGRSLNQVARTLGVPAWLKNLPPEAFTWRLADLPDEEDFSRRIANCLPASPAASAMWLRWVAFGAAVCDASFALWLARQRFYRPDPAGKTPLLPLAAFAWFSNRKDSWARNLTSQPWNRKMTFTAAAAEAQAWLDRLVLDYCCDWIDGGGGWYQDRFCGAYSFSPLLTRKRLEEEGVRMHNCVATYAAKVAAGRCLIYSIRRGDRSVATLEIAPGHRGAPMIRQLLGPSNTRAPEDVRRAVSDWLAQRGKCPLNGRTSTIWSALPIPPQRWEAVWRPFWEARPQFKSVLRCPETGAARLRKDLMAL